MRMLLFYFDKILPNSIQVYFLSRIRQNGSLVNKNSNFSRFHIQKLRILEINYLKQNPRPKHVYHL